MLRVIVAGIGTDVGKTIVSAILCKALSADYWKPVQCGSLSQTDSDTVRALVQNTMLRQHPSAYSFKYPGSPHYAAAQENQQIDSNEFNFPMHTRPLIIECVGGLCVPFTSKLLQVDRFASWNLQWVLVSKHYLGSINHSLLTLEALRARNQKIVGMIFNGIETPSSEEIILKGTQFSFVERLRPEKLLTPDIIEHYASLWKRKLKCLLPSH